MKTLYHFLKCLPFLSCLFSFWAITVCLQIINETGESKFLLTILCLQLYSNWFAILLASRNCTGVKRVSLFSLKINDEIEWSNYVNTKINNDIRESYNSKRFNQHGNQNYMPQEYPCYDKSSQNVERLWYCQKCCLNSREQCQHCPVCNKCVMGRDHHCFLLGTCIGKQNMKHFIVFLFYTSLGCLYTHILLSSYMNLYNESWYIIFQHLFPIYLGKWLTEQEYNESIFDIILLNVSATVSLFSFIFAIDCLFKLSSENNQMLKTISLKLRSIDKGGCGSALLNLVFPVTLLNYLRFWFKK